MDCSYSFKLHMFFNLCSLFPPIVLVMKKSFSINSWKFLLQTHAHNYFNHKSQNFFEMQLQKSLKLENDCGFMIRDTQVQICSNNGL